MKDLFIRNICMPFIFIGIFFAGRQSVNRVFQPVLGDFGEYITISLLCSFLLLIAVLPYSERIKKKCLLYCGVNFLLTLVFILFSLFTVVWTVGGEYATEKFAMLLNLFFIIVFLGLSSYIIKYDLLISIIRSMVNILVLFAVFYIFINFYSGSASSGERLGIAGSGSITIGRVFSFAAICAFYFLIENREKKQALKFIIFLLAVFASGSRGNFIYLVISTGGLIFLSNRITFSDKIKLFAILVSIIFFSFLILLVEYGSFKEIPFIYRYLIMFNTDESNLSILVRFEKYIVAYNMFLENYWGWGIGSYPEFTTSSDVIDYPHNVILEVLAELGVLGFLLFSTVVLLNILSLRKMDNLLFLLFVFSLLTAQSSGDLYDARLIFILPLFYTVKARSKCF
ncbi:O-antigen ligase family protein [Vibrio atlanticus]|uniref:O-antigen ligase family protein n=1 Tax=Vibrio atlanticus TaxID=693153 RepID=A0ABV4KPU4_9VIBR